jgi:hypothetical protein
MMRRKAHVDTPQSSFGVAIINNMAAQSVLYRSLDFLEHRGSTRRIAKKSG